MKGALLMLVGVLAFLAGVANDYFDHESIVDMVTLGLYIKSQIGTMIGIMTTLIGYAILVIEKGD